MCGQRLDLVPDVHHKDGNPENNDLLNLVVLCPNCHRKVEKSPEALPSNAIPNMGTFVGEKFDSDRFVNDVEALGRLRDPETRLKMIERIRHQTTGLPLDGMPREVRDAVFHFLQIMEKEVKNLKMRRLCLDILHIISRKRDSEVDGRIKELFLSWIEEHYDELSIEEKQYAIDIRQTLSLYDAGLLKSLMLDSIDKWSDEDFDKLYNQMEFYRLDGRQLKDLKMLLWKLRDEASKNELKEKVRRIDKLLEIYPFR